jgi:hypothetical protein
MFHAPQARLCLKKILFALGALLLTACETQVQELGSQDSSTTTDGTSAELTVAAQKGPFLDGSTVIIHELDSAGRIVRSKDVSKQFENLGRFRLNVPWSGPTLVEISGPFYDEFQGRSSAEQTTLRSVVDVKNGGKGVGNVNVITDLATARVLYYLQRGEPVETAMRVARQELMDSFGLGLPDGAMPSDLDLMNGRGNLAPDNASLLLFSGTVMATGSAAITDNLREEFATSGALDCGLESLQPIADTVSIDALAANLKNLDPTADPPDATDLAAANAVWLDPAAVTCDGSGGDDTDGGGTVDHMPAAANDAFSVAEDTSVSGDLGANDSGLEDGGIVYSLDSVPSSGTAVVNADGSFSYTPAPDYNGSDSFGYAVTDADGDASSATVSITVTAVDDIPVANDDAVSTSEGVSVGGDAANNDSGLGDGGISYALGAAPANGSASIASDGSFTYTPNPLFSGADSFGYQVSDADGDIASGTVTVTVSSVNAVPVANDDSVTVAEDASVSGDLSANDSGLEDGGIVYAPGGPPAHGTAVVNSDGSFTYTPAPDYNGGDSFGYSVSDVDGESSSATVSVTVTAMDDLPVATADSGTLDEDTQLSGDLAANDSGLVDGGIAYHLESGPANGSAQVASDGGFTYTPAADYNGTDSFTYAVSDADGDSATATVSLTINPVNDVPVAAADGASIAQGGSADIPVLDNDTGLGDGIGSVSVTQPSNGSATVGTDNVVTYTPDSAFHGSESFSYTVSDANGDSAVASIAVTVECTSCGQAVLSWDRPTTNTDGSELTDLTAYNVYYGTAPDDLANQVRIDDPTATGYTVDGLSGGWTYYFEVTAENAGGAESSPSNQVSKAITAGGP